MPSNPDIPEGGDVTTYGFSGGGPDGFNGVVRDVVDETKSCRGYPS